MTDISERMTQLIRFKDALNVIVGCHMTDSCKSELCEIKSGIERQIEKIIEDSIKEGVVL